jgi:hypothetical protein
MMKRKVPPADSTQKAKKIRSTEEEGPIEKTQTARQEAEPHRLATVRFPVDALTAEWSTGRNRDFDPTHKQELVARFRAQGIQEDAETRIRIMCSKADFEKMRRHLQGDKETWEEKEGEFPNFGEWQQVVGSQVELLAGRHRVEAWKELLLQPQEPPLEPSWVADVYDKDSLPLKTQIRLRVNRQQLMLEDGHGHTWTELVVAQSAGRDPKTSLTNGEIERVLTLGCREARKLVGLWNNLNWRRIITDLCETAVGRGCFGISPFGDRMATKMDEVGQLYDVARRS